MTTFLSYETLELFGVNQFISELPVSSIVDNIVLLNFVGSALHVMLFLNNRLRPLFIFNRLRNCHCQPALLGYHYHRDGLMVGKSFEQGKALSYPCSLRLIRTSDTVSRFCR